MLNVEFREDILGEKGVFSIFWKNIQGHNKILSSEYRSGPSGCLYWVFILGEFPGRIVYSAMAEEMDLQTHYLRSKKPKSDQI